MQRLSLQDDDRNNDRQTGNAHNDGIRPDGGMVERKPPTELAKHEDKNVICHMTEDGGADGSRLCVNPREDKSQNKIKMGIPIVPMHEGKEDGGEEAGTDTSHTLGQGCLQEAAKEDFFTDWSEETKEKESQKIIERTGNRDRSFHHPKHRRADGKERSAER